MICETTLGGDFTVDADTELQRLRKRDPDALAVLIERYQFRLYRYLFRLVGDPALAEDLFQQTWLRVVEKIRRYDARRSFEAWLFTVARNLAVDHFRKRRLDSLDEPLETGESRGALLRSESQNALSRVLEQERTALVMDKVTRLVPVHREVLTLRFEEEMKLEEIADVLDVPLGTVKSRLRRALLALRDELTAELGGGAE